MMLELKNIYKTYVQGKLDVPVLKNVSLSVDEGEYLAIMGPSGSGKTTLMNIIGCLDIPTSGEYLLEGQDIAKNNDVKMSEVRLHSIGFVFQSFYLLSRQSALENVALPLLYAGVRRKERLEQAKIALERVGLGDRISFKPTQLSGGQCQRVAIARAIVNNPKILLADEPTGALDTKSGEQIMEIFQKLNDEGVTVVMITHEPDIAAHAKRTIYIRDGRLTDEHGVPLSPDETEEAEKTSQEEASASAVETAEQKASAPQKDAFVPEPVSAEVLEAPASKTKAVEEDADPFVAAFAKPKTAEPAIDYDALSRPPQAKPVVLPVEDVSLPIHAPHEEQQEDVFTEASYDVEEITAPQRVVLPVEDVSLPIHAPREEGSVPYDEPEAPSEEVASPRRVVIPVDDVALSFYAKEEPAHEEEVPQITTEDDSNQLAFDIFTSEADTTEGPGSMDSEFPYDIESIPIEEISMEEEMPAGGYFGAPISIDLSGRDSFSRKTDNKGLDDILGSGSPSNTDSEGDNL